MAKSLRSLIRLHDWDVDEKRRVLSEYLGQIAVLEERARKLEESVIKEQKVAAEVPGEAGLYYGNFANLVIQRREQLAEAAAAVEKQIVQARENLRQAYRELKKYETAQANRDARELAESNRREQIDLDEIGIQGFLRKRK